MVSYQIRLTLQVQELVEIMRREKDQDSCTGPDIVLRWNNFQSSTKLDALVHDLSAHRITPLSQFTQRLEQRV